MDSNYKYQDANTINRWINDIPGHWKLKRLKNETLRNDGGVWGNEPDGIDDTVVLRSTEQSADGSWKIEFPAYRKLTSAEKSKSTLLSGDLLVTKSSGSELHIGKTSLVSSEIEEMHCCYSNFMQRLRLKESLDPKFCWYFMNNELAREQFNYLSNTTTGLSNLNSEIFGELLIPYPPINEQVRIVNFLDRETAKIDGLIQKQERFIKLVDEERKAIINQTICRGLNKRVELKNTGIPWLENIPTHWDIKPLKYLISFNDEVLAESTPDDFELKYVEIGDVSERLGITNITEVEFKDAASRARRLVKDGDILISTVRTYLRAIAPVKNPPSNMVVSTGFAVIRPQNLNSDFGRFLLSTEYFLNEVIARSTGVSYPAINASDLVQIKVPVPPIDEQEKIAEFIKTKCEAIEILVNKSESSIRLLKEHRATLISSAITGKFDS